MLDGELHILILEDNAADAELARRELRKAGLCFVMECVQDRASFLDRLSSFAPDIVLVDFALPGFNGLTAMAEARQRFAPLPVIVVSGAIGEERAIEALKAGATDYVLKDRLSRLGPVVKRALEDARRLRDTQRAQEALARQGEQLRQNEEQLRLLLAGVTDYAIFMLDAQGRIVSWAPGAQRIKQWRAEEIIGQHFSVFYTPEDIARGRPRQELEQAVREGHYEEEAPRRRKDGSVFWAQVSITPVYDAKGQLRGFAKVVRDRSERRQAEQTLAAAKRSAEQSREIAEKANQAKDHFLAILSHELRTPLTPALTAVAMLQEDSRFDAATRETLEVIRRNVDLEARLIDDLLDVTRIARGKVELQRRAVDLCMVIRRAVEVCMPDIKARQLEFGVKVEDGPHIVDADPARMQQVFWNLLKNAVKFTPHGGCVGIECHRDTEGCVIARVVDSGEGIGPEALPRLFRPFEQESKIVTRQFGGLGLGLAISQAIVELHGGTITAFSQGKGKGASFTVRLPICASAVRGIERDVPAGMAKSTALNRKLSILFVEDHGDTSRIMKRVLNANGHEVRTAGDVATALALLGSDAFDLLISDLGLPDGSGYDLMRAVRSRGLAMPGIALSGYGQDQDVQHSREAGFAVHLTKPTTPAQLLAAIASLMVDAVKIP